MAQERRAFLPAEVEIPSPLPLSLPTVVQLNQDESHHLIRVLRLSIDDEVVVIAPSSGRTFLSKIHSLENKAVSVVIVSELEGRRAASPFTLVAPLLKGDHTEEVIEKATELGIATIVIYQAERSVVKVLSTDIESRRSRWNRVCIAAVKQCRRSSPPLLSFAPSLEAALSGTTSALYASLKVGAIPLATAERPPQGSALIVGPEGDFSPAEEALLSRPQFSPVSLGSLVLRSETAAMVMASTALMLWGLNCHHEMP